MILDELIEKVGEVELCKYCKYNGDCNGMSSDGAGEPLFPPCSDIDSKEDISYMFDIGDVINKGDI